MLGDRPNTYPSGVVATRRLGTETSETRATLLDATEQLMLDSGYAAVSSRRVAAVAGVRPALVHYYFRTMDDLFLAAFQRRAEQAFAHQQRALQSPQPLWSLWEVSRDPRGTVLTMEFSALANHRPAIRAEIAAAAERIRAQQVAMLTDALAAHGVTADDCPPVVAAVLIAGISVLLALEQGSLAMSTGHTETIAYVEGFLTRLEGERVTER
jgi:TetR/AcrR family transcriptional regulator